jgi:hypothetical protein
MPSPFPGMNPYIEKPSVWQDFHARFIAAAAERIGTLVYPRYYVRIDEYVFIHEFSADERKPLGRPDLVFTDSGGTAGGGTPGGGATAVAAPAEVGIPATAVDVIRHRFLEIRDRDSTAVVTVVELLSPSNKASGQGREEYWNKVRRLVATTYTSLVELDLLRGGVRLPWDQLPACDYYALVSRPADRRRDPPKAAVWPVRLRDPLPPIPIPLAPGEPEVTLDLQAVIHHVYDTAGYRYSLYRTPPEPPLAPDDAAWAAQILRDHLPPGGA